MFFFFFFFFFFLVISVGLCTGDFIFNVPINSRYDINWYDCDSDYDICGDQPNLTYFLRLSKRRNDIGKRLEGKIIWRGEKLNLEQEFELVEGYVVFCLLGGPPKGNI